MVRVARSYSVDLAEPRQGRLRRGIPVGKGVYAICFGALRCLFREESSTSACCIVLSLCFPVLQRAMPFLLRSPIKRCRPPARRWGGAGSRG